jgi:CheY-like chemotaxis protein
MLPQCNTILVAEDNLEDAFLLKRAFQKAGVNARMELVRDGIDAIAYLKGECPYCDRLQFPFPGLLLLDLKMPKADGFTVLRWIQTQEGMRRLLVTVLSSSEEPEDVNRAYDLGANSYLVKPSRLEGLGSLVKRIQAYWMELNFPPDCAWAALQR